MALSEQQVHTIVRNEITVASVTSTGSTTARTLANRFADVVNVKDFAAVGDGVADDTTALQAAIDAAATHSVADPTTGPSEVYCPAGKYLLGQITLKDRVIIVGDGPQSTFFKAKNGLNDHLFLSNSFATLTGQNKWAVADGVLSFIGFKSCQIDGNKSNQTAGDGVRLYAKGLFFDNVIIRDCFANGLYTEAGESASVSSWDTLPEGSVGLLYLLNNGSHGWHLRGPHDVACNTVLPLINGGDGIRVESSSGVYLASADFKHLHSYANVGRGLYVIGSEVRGTFFRLENNDQEGLYLQTTTTCEFGNLHLFDNCQVSGTFQGEIDSGSLWNVIGSLLIRDVGRAAAGGLRIVGDNNYVKGIIRGNVTGGGNSTGVGLDIANGATHNLCDVIISEFSGAAAVGLRTGQTAAILFNQVKAVLQNCTTLWDNVTTGAANIYKISGDCSSSQTKFAGNGPETNVLNREFWEINLRDDTPTIVLSEQHLSGSVDLNITTEQTITVTHALVATPLIGDVQASIVYTGANTTWAIQYVKVHSVSATQIVCKVKLSTAAGSAETGTLNIHVRI